MHVHIFVNRDSYKNRSGRKNVAEPDIDAPADAGRFGGRHARPGAWHPPGACAPRPAPPNIVFLLADDLGYADLSCYGRNFSTPRIDSLAREGALFTQAYASSAGVLRHARLAHDRPLTRPPAHRARRAARLRSRRDDRPARRTSRPCPRCCARPGYRTSLFGKWHLGKPPKFGPLKSGYDRFFGMYGGYSFYFGHGKDDPSPIIDGERILTDHGYLTDLLADEGHRRDGDSARATRGRSS